MKIKQPALVVAAALAEVTKKVGRAYVFTSLSKTILQQENASAAIAQHKFAEFACADCGTVFDGLSEVAAPFCFCCGSEKVQKKEVKASQHIHPDSELVSITCSACASINVTHAEIAKTAKNSIHCSACGTQLMHITVEKADGEGDVSVDDMDTLDVDEATDLGTGEPGGDTGDTGEMMLSESEDTSDKGEEADGDSVDEGEEEEGDSADSDFDEGDEVIAEEGEEEAEDLHDELPSDLPTGKSETDDAEDLHDELPSGGEPKGGDSENLNDQLPTQPVKEGGSAKKVKADAEVLDTNDAGDSDNVEDIDMTDMVSDNVEEMSIIAMGNKILLASGPYVFASLSEEQAGDNKDIFQTAQFQKAIIASLKIDGAKKTMEAFNFSPVIVKANIAKHVDKLVSQKLSEKAAELDKLRDTLTADFKQSLDIAAVGLNKSFWKGVQNPLKAALTKELSNLGLRNPEKLVARIFEQHGLAYASTLIEQSTQLLTKTKDSRNELSTVLDMTNSVVTAENEEEEDEDMEGLDTLEAALKPVSKERAAALKRELHGPSSRSQSRVQEILGSSDEPLFSN